MSKSVSCHLRTTVLPLGCRSRLTAAGAPPRLLLASAPRPEVVAAARGGGGGMLPPPSAAAGGGADTAAAAAAGAAARGTVVPPTGTFALRGCRADLRGSLAAEPAPLSSGRLLPSDLPPSTDLAHTPPAPTFSCRREGR
jgi:hypothetical protein